MLSLTCQWLPSTPRKIGVAFPEEHKKEGMERVYRLIECNKRERSTQLLYSLVSFGLLAVRWSHNDDVVRFVVRVFVVV
jgi:hypothetical protein